MNRKKVLVLVIDIDDDLGSVGIKTPIIGFSEVQSKALEFARRKPSDSDVNALFAGLSIYEKLKRMGHDVEIAVIAGDREDRTRGLLRVNSVLDELKNTIGFEDVYFVSDGVSDEQLLPVVGNYGRVIGVERVIVEQSPGIEETYILLIRYLKKAFSEKPYSKFFLGIPGVLLVIFSIMALAGLSQYIWDVILLLLGIIFMVKGFGFTGWLREKWEHSPLIAVLYVSSMLFLSLALFMTGLIIYFKGWTIDALIGVIRYTTFPYLLGVLLLYGGRLFDKVISANPHLLWRDSLIIIPVVFLLIIAESILPELENSRELGTYYLLNILFSSNVVILLFIAVIVTFATTLFFVILDRLLANK